MGGIRLPYARARDKIEPLRRYVGQPAATLHGPDEQIHVTDTAIGSGDALMNDFALDKTTNQSNQER